ncbi:pimeloyl-[acyl-carrier protein] methyl ester esterase [Anoxybacillus vitaminiphilus]|uniref:Pimeloyl-[acyl-carrier protein] methyl ester esterase n=1 Tax=Paranoxybacillus vitaminiphilus TaxID=581036 RepID=A0A327XZV0_9BACL|nr:alpha/beta hydrolase [Anoxybacillus vitaminiphilus]RAK14273.1 pimeloyl-[acyl-carrier protein] methyl ester esterase [Anoxybacillus vitaminiphilus]
MNKQKHIVLIPGWGMRGTVWLPLVERLKTPFAISYVEWDGIKTMADLKQKAVQLVEKNGLSSFIPIGWSLGALIALELAISFPEKIDRLVLISGTSRFIKGDGYDAGWERRVVERMKRQLMRNREQTLSSFFASLLCEEEQDKALDFECHFHSTEQQGLLAGLDYLMTADVRFALREITAPLLLIHGEEDTICPPSASRYIFEQIKDNAILKLLPKTGHVPFLTKTDECARMIQSFVGGIT